LCFLPTQARGLIFLSFYGGLYLGVSHGWYFGQNIFMYMGGLYNYCIVICVAVLTTFHSVLIFPRYESGAFNGDYSGVQGLSHRTCARNLPSVGFAILRAFQGCKSDGGVCG